MDDFQQARAFAKEYAKTFYFASRFLNKDKRNAAYAVYAICRISDETVDNPALLHPGQNLEQLKKNIAAVYSPGVLDNALLSALRQSVEKYKIPREYFSDLIAGMHLDLKKNRYKNFAELRDYCYKVAGVVGLMVLEIFGYADQKAKNYAVDLGIAMQLTNILRDIKEDFKRGRIYIPQDELASFGISQTDISQEKISERFKALLKFQIARAREYYANSKSGIKLINDANSRFVVWAMADIYSGILNSIEKINYNVFSRRAQVSLFGKIVAVLKILLKGEYR